MLFVYLRRMLSSSSPLHVLCFSVTYTRFRGLLLKRKQTQYNIFCKKKIFSSTLLGKGILCLKHSIINGWLRAPKRLWIKDSKLQRFIKKKKKKTLICWGFSISQTFPNERVMSLVTKSSLEFFACANRTTKPRCLKNFSAGMKSELAEVRRIIPGDSSSITSLLAVK